jgi:hypothetical protein
VSSNYRYDDIDQSQIIGFFGGLGTWYLGLGTGDLGLGTWDLVLGIGVPLP